MDIKTIEYKPKGQKEAISLAYQWLEPAPHAADKPVIVWLGGFRSDMMGSKAQRLHDWALAAEHGFLRFDYSGHGMSGGDFKDGTISGWTDEARFMIEHFTGGSALLVGSSMGGWIALKLAQKPQHDAPRIAGMVLVAPAPDFTELLIKPKLKPEQNKALEDDGYFEVMTPYGPVPHVFTRALFEDGKRAGVLERGIVHTHCPIHILQGTEDVDVPMTHAYHLMDHLVADNATLTLVKGGDHRLSRSEDLALLERSVASMLEDEML